MQHASGLARGRPEEGGGADELSGPRLSEAVDDGSHVARGEVAERAVRRLGDRVEHGRDPSREVWVEAFRVGEGDGGSEQRGGRGTLAPFLGVRGDILDQRAAQTLQQTSRLEIGS